MDREREKKLLDELSSNERRVVENLSDYARGKVLEKLDSGYTISNYDGYEVEVKKGYSYYGITKGGSVYAK